ncbi:MAG: hypothetical protein JNL38_23200 [Myxococcales bacterium]|nr:hypothetical protein [Myxococcales bacterium]
MRLAMPLRMFAKTLLFLALFGGAAAAVACAPVDDAPTCSTGGYVFCRCANRAKGTKKCVDGHRFTECKVEGRIACVGGEVPDPDTGVAVTDPTSDTLSGGTTDAPPDGGVAAKCGDGKIDPGEACDDPPSANRCDPKTCRAVVGGASAGGRCPGDLVHAWASSVTIDLDTDTLASTVPSLTACGDTPGNDFVVQVMPHKTGHMSIAWVSKAARSGAGGLPVVAVLETCPIAGVAVKANACKTAGVSDLTVDVVDGRPVWLVFDAKDAHADINVVATLQIR